jgi:hypothetical protein
LSTTFQPGVAGNTNCCSAQGGAGAAAYVTFDATNPGIIGSLGGTAGSNGGQSYGPATGFRGTIQIIEVCKY